MFNGDLQILHKHHQIAFADAIASAIDQAGLFTLTAEVTVYRISAGQRIRIRVVVTLYYYIIIR